MGQKVNPHGMRVGVIKDWDSKWYADKKSFADYLVEDNRVREYVKKKLYLAGIARVLIERAADNQMRVKILAGKPGMIIGRSGKGIEDLKAEVEKFVGHAVNIRVIDLKTPDTDAQLIAENIAQQLEKRIAFRRAMKQSIQRAMRPMKGGEAAKGIKVAVSGRLNGADIARSEQYHEGSIPLQTLRANIDYGFAEAKTTYGRLGVKVWIYKGQVLPQAKKPAQRTEGGK